MTNTYDYSYDEASRLWQVRLNGVLVSTYLYDANGNRLSYTSPSGTINASYDDQDRLPTIEEASYTYTANGELLSKTEAANTTTYAYDDLGTCAQVTCRRHADRLPGRRLRTGASARRSTACWYRASSTRMSSTRLPSWTAAAMSSAALSTPRGQRARLHDQGRSYLPRSSPTTWAARAWWSTPPPAKSRSGWTTTSSATCSATPTLASSRLALPEELLTIIPGWHDLELEITMLVTGRWTSKYPIGFSAGDTDLYSYVWNDPANLSDPIGEWVA